VTVHVVPSILLLGVGVVLALVAAGLFLRGLRQRRIAVAFLDRAVASTAEVVEVEAKDVAFGGEPDTRYYPRVRFAAADGSTVEAESMTDSALPPPHVGEIVEVLYDPVRPERVDLVRRANRIDGVGRTSFLMGWLVLSVALATPMAWLVLVLVVWTS
jgi:hypothetical protein